jgi:hypothetical protein
MKKHKYVRMRRGRRTFKGKLKKQKRKQRRNRDREQRREDELEDWERRMKTEEEYFLDAHYYRDC